MDYEQIALNRGVLGNEFLRFENLQASVVQKQCLNPKRGSVYNDY